MLRPPPSSPERGATLIELVIAIAIVALLFGFGLPSYRTWIQNSQIRTATESLLAGLQLARSEAVRRNSRVDFELSATNTTDWKVLDGNTSQTIQSRVGAEGSPNAAVSISPSGATTITFNGLGRVTSTAPVTLSISNSSGGKCQAAGGDMRCLNIVVSVGGQIRMCDPALPSSNPQSCSA